MINKTIWCYWESYKPPYIDYCLKSIIKRSGVNVVILTPQNTEEYIGNELDRRWKKLTWIAQKTDVIRMSILYNHGGLWVDADTLWLKDCNYLFDNDYDFTAMRWTFNHKILNGYIMAKKGSVVIKRCIDWINGIFKQNFCHSYMQHGGVFFGEHMIKEVIKEHEINELPLETFIPIEFPKDKRVWFRPEAKLIDYDIRRSVCIALNHSQNKAWVNQCTIENMMQRNCLIGDVFRYSESKGGVLK